jgi:dTDP-4-dehydrorhamnose reductase
VILLFGANGQLGQEFTRQAGGRGIAITALSRTASNIAEADEVADALRKHTPDIVINAAAYTNVDLAEEEYELALRANAIGPAVLGKACNSAGIPLVHFSTDYVFDGLKAGAYREDDATAPLGAYGQSKAIGEDNLRSVAPMHLIVRTSWVYGEFGKNFLKTMLRLAAERDELRVVADQRGNPTSTATIAEAILSIVPRLLAPDAPWGTYHLAGTGTTSWHGFAERIVELQAQYTKRKPVVLPISTSEFPTKTSRPMNSALDCSRFTETFGITAAPWDQECKRVIEAVFRPEQPA